MQHGATSVQLRGFPLIACSLCQIVESFLARNFQTDRFKSRIHDSTKYCLRSLSRAALALSMLRRLTVAILRARCACSETTNDALWTMSGLCSRAHHLREKINIIICLTRHLLANRVQ